MIGFIIAGFLVGVYALVLHRFISGVGIRVKFVILLCMILIFSAFDALMSFFISISGEDTIILPSNFALYRVILILGSMFSPGIITPLLIFENYLPEKYLNMIVVAWSLILTPALLINTEVNSGKFDFLQFFSVDILRTIPENYRFTATFLLNYLEIAIITAIFYGILSALHIKINPERRGC